MYYKTLHKRLMRYGWTISMECTNGSLWAVEYTQAKHRPLSDYGRVILWALPKKDGTPGRVISAWLDENSCTSAFKPF